MSGPDAGQRRAWQRWGVQGEAWHEWLRRSPLGVELFTWWQEAGDYLWLVGDDTYREHLVDVLSRASPRDCAAAGLGCARRIDRACRDPLVCGQDPAVDAMDDDLREGPLPGACDTFYGYRDDLRIWVLFGGGDRHRAVFWCAEGVPVRLWVDGRPVDGGLVDPHVADVALDSLGTWVGGRFFVVNAAGPDDHPSQSFQPGELVTRIVSVLIHDAELASSQLLVPQPHESWTQPHVVLDGSALHMYADQAAFAAGDPDRVLPIEPTPA